MNSNVRIALALFALIGVLVAGMGGVEVWMESGTSWAQTDGTVVKSEVKRVIHPVDPQFYRRFQWSSRVTYRYQVAGKSYTSDRMHAGIHANDEVPTKGAAQNEVDRYPVGAKVTVYYDPTDPSTAALKVGAGGGWTLVVIGFLILAGGGVFAWRQGVFRA